MHRKTVLTIIGASVLVALAIVLAWAQTVNEIELTKTNIQAERQQIVSDYMNLNDQEASKFWPVYKNYRNDMSKLNDRLIKAGQSFANSYDSLTDDQARTLLSEFQDIQSKRIKTQTKYAPKFESAIGAKKTLRFYQLENKMDAVVSYDLAGTVPLAK
ncbi:MAG: hypothetical protein ABFD64_00860 [Armatimonadota bacterium]